MSARRKEIEGLSYWPRELAAIIARYSALTRDERLSLLLPGPQGQIVIIPGESKYNTLSMYWTNIIGYRQIFLRHGGVQSREMRMDDFLRMTSATSIPHGWRDQVFYRRLWDFFVVCHGKGIHPKIVMNEFIDAFKSLFAKIET